MNFNKLNEDLSRITKMLLFKYPYYGILLLSLDKSWEKVGTALVAYKDLSFYLKLDPDFWDTLNENAKMGLLMHELNHISFFHLTEFQSIDTKSKEISNIAKDLEVNQNIPKECLPDGALLPKTFPNLDLEDRKGTHYYFDKLFNNQNGDQDLQKMLEAMENNHTLVELSNGKTSSVPDHDWETNITETEKKLLETQLVKILDDVVEEVKRGKGTLPAGLESILERKKQKEAPKVDWKKAIRKFVGKSQRTYIKSSRRKPNLRVEEFAGIRHIKYKKILTVMDTSASVDNKELLEFYNELDFLDRTKVDIDIGHCDVTFTFIGKYKASDRIKIHGRGGTNFQEPIDFYNKNLNKYNCLIYFTDGECPAPENAKGNILWIITNAGFHTKDLPGVTIKMK